MSLPTPDSYQVPLAGIPHGSVVITPSQIYDKVLATHDLAKEIKGDLGPMHDQIIDHETRLRGVERRLWFMAGAAAAVGGGIAEIARLVFG